MPQAASIEPTEIAQFSAHAEDWWNPHGKFKPLHRLNPVRMEYVRDQACRHFGRNPTSRHSLKGLTVLDVGCGGGLMTEPIARLGAQVTGIDGSRETIAVAQSHAEASRLKIDYQVASVEELVQDSSHPPLAGGSNGKAVRGGVRNASDPSPAKTKDLLRKSRFLQPLPQGERKYDLITALEVAEHVADMDSFFSGLQKLLKPDGLLIMSTLNRTPKSFLLGIVAAEYILQWVPRGTHQWKKFIRPSELQQHLEEKNMHITNLKGLVFNPLRNAFELSQTDLAVNYLLTASFN